jgi:hypothetical protein
VLEDFLNKRDETQVAPSLVVTGPPGSGKSVTLRTAARQGLQFYDAEGLPRYIPVLLSFADYRRNNFDLELSVAESLKFRGFGRHAADTEHFVVDFVHQELYRGRILVLLDGLDELKIEDRKEASNRLVAFLRQNPQLPSIISCRTVPFREHKAQFTILNPHYIEMAEFIPAAIKQFVSRWRFDPPKNNEGLLRILGDRSHLREMAKNPLMLTIITFLYSLPKYRLPDNRAQFYEVCARALLEEWDQSMASERANQFDRPHKEDLLARLAFEHLQGPDPDSDIKENFVYDHFATWMRELGLIAGNNVKIVKEIEYNSGLLVPLPPNGLRFPHQTFLEYFAALFLLRHASYEDVATHYIQDPKRWREVLLLYCGLSTDVKAVSEIIDNALADDDVELALEILTNARTIAPEISQKVLLTTKNQMQMQPTPSLIEHLGYLAANQLSDFAEEAYKILAICLQGGTQKLTDEVLQALILAIMRKPTEEDVNLIIENFERLQLQRILPTMGDNALILVGHMMALESLSPEKKKQWVESLRLANMPRLLYEIMHDSQDEQDLHLAAIALARLSKQNSFWNLLDNPSIPELKRNIAVEGIINRWGWPHSVPRTSHGRYIAISLANHVAKAMLSGSYSDFASPKQDLHHWLSYLAHGIAYKEQYPRIPQQAMVSPQSLITECMPNMIVSLWKVFCIKRKGLENYIRVLSFCADNWYISMLSIITFYCIPSSSIFLWSFISTISYTINGSTTGLEFTFSLGFFFFYTISCLVFTIICKMYGGGLTRGSLLLISFIYPLITFYSIKETLRYKGKSLSIPTFMYVYYSISLIIFTFISSNFIFNVLLLTHILATCVYINYVLLFIPFLFNIEPERQLLKYLSQENESDFSVL